MLLLEYSLLLLLLLLEYSLLLLLLLEYSLLLLLVLELSLLLPLLLLLVPLALQHRLARQCLRHAQVMGGCGTSLDRDGTGEVSRSLHLSIAARNIN